MERWELDLICCDMALMRFRLLCILVYDCDRLKRHILLTGCLILLDLFLITEYPVIMTDAYKLRLVCAVVMHGWIVGV